MKPYAVVKFRDDLIQDIRIPLYPGNARYAWYPYQKAGANDGTLDNETMVWYCDDEPSATHLASTLATRYPNTCYSVVKTGVVMICRAGPVMTTQWTDKGLLPI